MIKHDGFIDKDKIVIICTERQANYIKRNGCIALDDDICECENCENCLFDPNNIEFIIKNPNDSFADDVREILRDSRLSDESLTELNDKIINAYMVRCKERKEHFLNELSKLYAR